MRRKQLFSLYNHLYSIIIGMCLTSIRLKWIFIPKQKSGTIWTSGDQSRDRTCVEMDTFICELHFYFSPTLYNRHPHRFDKRPLPPSALCSVSTATPFHSVSALAPSPECAVSDQAVCGCLSVTHQLSALEGGQSREEDGKPWLLLDGHLAGAHIY